ncbi:MAG: hypothetical protein JNM78_06165 [Cyclobacteriaceae bacterium]|nr:hypothetical protein [Cyclobacteriaceae bacterium]
MAGTLWISNRGKRRKGTTFKDLQIVFDTQVTTKHIYEPLSCAFPDDLAQEIHNEMTELDFDILGVVDKLENVIGFVKMEQLKDGNVMKYMNPFDLSIVATDSTPIYRLIQILEKREFVFVMHGTSIDGIVTLADINKPIVRLYLFGVISLFEMHLNYWLKHLYQNGSWKKTLKPNRIEKAEEIFKERIKHNQALTLEECLQLCDKRDVLCQCKPFLNDFNYSEEEFRDQLKKCEKIRNELAHNQDIIFAGFSMEQFSSIITSVESFIKKSEPRVMALEAEKIK